MIVVGPDFMMWTICLLFGAFCVWKACSITKDLGAAASKELGAPAAGPAAPTAGATSPAAGAATGSAATTDSGALNLHIGQWLTVATRSPAVAFFALAVAAGVGLPAFYSYLYRPDGPQGYDEVTVQGQFDASVPNVCFQNDSVISTASGYAIKIPRQTKGIDYIIQPQNMLGANLFLEVDGSSAWYSIDNAAAKPAAVDHNGVIRINDAIPLKGKAPSDLAPQQPVGTQTTTLTDALTGKQQ